MPLNLPPAKLLGISVLTPLRRMPYVFDFIILQHLSHLPQLLMSLLTSCYQALYFSYYLVHVAGVDASLLHRMESSETRLLFLALNPIYLQRKKKKKPAKQLLREMGWQREF